MITNEKVRLITISVRLCTEKHKEVDDARWRLRLSIQEFVRRAIDRELTFQSPVTRTKADSVTRTRTAKKGGK